MMKLTKVKIDNFYNLREVHLDLRSGNTLIVGPNGSGKTNVIKCVQFLVEKILSECEEPANRKSKHNYLEHLIEEAATAQADEVSLSSSRQNGSCYVEVDAEFSEAELVLFSDWSVLFLVADVCNLVHSLAKYYLRESISKPKDLEHDRHALWKKVQKGHLHAAFPSLPEATVKILSTESLVSREESQPSTMVGNLLRDDLVMDSPCMAALLKEVTNKIFTELQRITREALLKQHSISSSAQDAPNVVFKVHAEKNVPNYSYTTNIKKSTWLPEDVFCDVKGVICDTLHELFGEMEDVEIAILFRDLNTNEPPTYGSLENVVQKLLNPGFKQGYTVYVRSTDFPQTFPIGNCATWIPTHGQVCDMLRSTSWGITFRNCFLKLGAIMGDGVNLRSRKGFYQVVSRSCLRSSMVNYILPQRRDGKVDNRDHTVSSDVVEQLLISAKLSKDETVRSQLKKVKNGMKAFCGLKIQIIEEGITEQDNKEVAKELTKLAKEVPKGNMASLFETGNRISRYGQKVMQSASPRDGGDLQVVLTRASRDGASALRTMHLSDLSGGEIEVLLVLCSIHLSKAGTVFLDEPGHCLHPPQQAQLRRWIETLKHPADPVCVVVTHSAEFVSHYSLNSLYRMAMAPEGKGFTTMKLTIQVESQDEPSEMDTEPSTHSTSSSLPPGVVLSSDIVSELMRPDMRKMFFASGVYFVEGETDKLVLSALRFHLLQKARGNEGDPRSVPSNQRDPGVLGMDQWDVLALGGCGNAMKAYRASTELKIPCALVLDADAISEKPGSRVLPVDSRTWKNSKLGKALKNQAQSLEIAETLLDKINALFSESGQRAVEDEIRQILQEHGIWVWKGDLESEICDKHRGKLEGMIEDLLEALGKLSLSPRNSRGKISIDQALGNYKEKILVPLESLMEEVRDELYSVRDQILMDPSQRVTEGLQALIGQLKAFKQPLEQHDNFCEKGSKRPAEEPSGGLGSPKRKCAPEASTSQEQPQHASPDVDMPADKQSIPWYRIKRELHSGGWGKLPWKTLVKMMEVCIEDEGSPLREFCEFMKQWQGKSMN